MESTSIGRRLFLCAAISLASFATACADGENNNPSGGAGGESSTATGTGSSSTATGTGGTGTGGSGSGGEGGGTPIPKDPEFVAKFDPGIGELPEGLVIDGTTAYVSFGVNPKIVKVDLTSGTVSDYSIIGSAPIGIGFPQGLAFDAQKNLFVAIKSEDPTQFKPGIYKVPTGGGEPTLFASDPNMSWPRSIAFAPDGTALVTVPPASRFLLVDSSGAVTDNGVSAALSGDQSSPCAVGGGVIYGVTSAAAVSTDALYLTNADRATVVMQTMMGTSVLAGPDCATLGGAESMVVDQVNPVDTDFIVAARKANKITRVKMTGEVAVMAADKNLYQPSALAIATIGGKRFLYIVNSASSTFQTGGIPGLLRMPL